MTAIIWMHPVFITKERNSFILGTSCQHVAKGDIFKAFILTNFIIYRKCRLLFDVKLGNSPHNLEYLFQQVYHCQKNSVHPER